jgi:hypothetical protein
MKSVFCERICSTVAIAILLFSATFAFSQGIVTGSVSGVVEDQQGAVVPNANVTVIQLATNRVFRTQTTSAGIISLRDLSMGAYNLRIRGAPDPILDDVTRGSFQNTNFNSNGGLTFAGNINTDGIGRRRLLFGMKLIF